MGIGEGSSASRGEQRAWPPRRGSRVTPAGALLALIALALATSGACRCAAGPSVVEALPELVLLEPQANAGGGWLLDFGRVRAGSTYSRRLVLENRGRAGLQLTALSLLDASAELSLSAPSLPAVVGPGEPLHVTVAYAPTASGSSAGRAVIESNDPRLPRVSVQVRGAADAPSLVVCVYDAAALRCDRDEPKLALDFGVVPPGAGPVRRQLVLQNVAPVDLRLSGASTLPPTSAEFRLLAPLPTTLAAGAEAHVPIAYEPVDGGKDEGLLEIRSDDPLRPAARLPMTGGCAAPRLCPEPDRIDFGTRIARGGGAERTLRLGSCGLTELVVSSLEVGPSEFTSASLPPLPARIAPGDALTLRLRYSPQEPGSDRGSLSISSNDSATPRAAVALNGTAVAEAACDLEVSPRSVHFGQVPVSGFSERLLFLSNIGEAPCRLSAIAAPSGSDSFTVPEQLAAETALEPGGFRTLRVRYAPERRSSERAALVVASDDPLEPAVEVELTGLATVARACELMLVPAQLHFGIALSGEPRRERLELHNFGSSACLITEAALAPGSSPAFSLVTAPELPSHLPPGASRPLEVAFSPTSGSQHLGTVQVRGGESTGSAVHEAQLAGLFGRPRLCLSPTLLDFGGGAGLRTLSFRLSSCGSAPLELRGLPLSGEAFELIGRPRLPFELSPGDDLDLAVSYQSPFAQAAFGRLAVLSSDESQPEAAVLLRANAEGCLTRALRCAPTELPFPNTPVAQATTLAFACANVGLEPVRLSSIEVEQGAGFGVDHRPLPLRLDVGERLSVLVELAPTEAGLHEASVEVVSDDCQTPRETIRLAGTALPATERPCPASGPLSALLEWQWAQPAVAPESTNVWMTPLVVRLDDDNGDGRVDLADSPDVVFISHAKPADPTRPDPTPPGVLRALDGRTGEALWEVVTPALNASAQLAAADLDGDGRAEIVGLRHTGSERSEHRLAAFSASGDLLWLSQIAPQPEQAGDNSALSIADLDADGSPEIVVGTSVFDARGRLLWQGCAGQGSLGSGFFATVADLDGDGQQEVIAGSSVYSAQGLRLWTFGAGDGLTAVADLDRDGAPEIVLRAGVDELHLLDSQGRLEHALRLPAPPPEACAAPVSLADLDGDRGLELIVPAGDALFALRPSGELLWTVPIEDTDGQCGASGAAAFDFDGDGAFEVIHHDALSLRVLSGRDGSLLLALPRVSSTQVETPVIADLDGDGRVEILVTQQSDFEPVPGLLVLGGLYDDWPGTRGIWNEHGYRAVNVTESGLVPRAPPAPQGFRFNPPRCQRSEP